MPINTGSILHRLQNDLGRAQGGVKRAQAQVEKLRREYATTDHWARPNVTRRGFQARRELELAEAELRRATEALRAEETRLLQPDSFLRFG